ncbi:hypothetical protein NLU13_1096 [Sarocladium strictum]|uniref:Methyltransferase type 12 domain-containing protein n=1 Tax=Sarocladium strictum TaxID=5046 RepID=A0AA39GQJ7_SARSR|nr:hypothetical protein NLU13_1096 [Sarocladium strictum]
MTVTCRESIDDYVLGRGIRDSIRLDAQHLLWRLHQGYALHPSIPVTSGLRIAEVGTGTAMWLLDLATSLPRDVQLHGYDISSAQFPPPSTLPKNIQLSILNSFETPPLRLVGYYDVVHVRMWASNLRARDLGDLIQNISAMLKPGGFIQWEDADLIHQNVRSPAAEAFEKDVNSLFKEAKIDYNWVSGLPQALQQAGFQMMDQHSHEFCESTMHLCTRTYLMALTEILSGIKRSCATDLLPLVTNCEGALSRLMQDSTKDLVYNWRPMAVLAQKL